jgi:hypothetical protein
VLARSITTLCRRARACSADEVAGADKSILAMLCVAASTLGEGRTVWLGGSGPALDCAGVGPAVNEPPNVLGVTD